MTKVHDFFELDHLIILKFINKGFEILESLNDDSLINHVLKTIIILDPYIFLSCDTRDATNKGSPPREINTITFGTKINSRTTFKICD